ncbi:hypothetical protein [Bradyrhizobium sp. ORS 375]|uniref:hypothetical protein n=1 Tax=Bradyrhizobium sp. (strain ORS 375) TaxID=566679 RepID=UPI0002F44236|nr:hypothetical protein [Bradyrhizobium sp. ORS 375]
MRLKAVSSLRANGVIAGFPAREADRDQTKPAQKMQSAWRSWRHENRNGTILSGTDEMRINGSAPAMT